MDVEKIKKLLLPEVEQAGYKLASVAFEKENNEQYLRVYVYSKDHFMDLEEIVLVSETISTILDKHLEDADPYILDVSSAGAEREVEISELPSLIDKYLKFTLHSPVKDSQDICATLVSLDDQLVNVKVNNKGQIRIIKLEMTNIKQINLAIKI